MWLSSIQAVTAEVGVGDIVRAGYDFVNHEDALGPTSIRTCAFRLMCGNGAVFSENLGGITRRASAKKPTKDDVFDAINSAFTRTVLQPDLTSAIRKSRETELGTVAPLVISQLRPHVSAETLRDRFEQHIGPTATFYDAANEITSYAHGLRGLQARRFQQLGGSLFEVFAMVHDTIDSTRLAKRLSQLWQNN
jgi:hypothetical protein